MTLPAHLFSWFLLKANFLRKPVNVRVRCPVHRVRTFLRCQSSQFHSQCCSRGKLDSLNASSLSNIITQSLLICICEKSQYGLINLPKRISMEKSDLKILVQKTQLQSSASSSSLVSPEFRSKTGVFAGAVNVSMEGSPHLVTLLLSPFTQSQPHP